MKCIILAAGYATRLYPLTENFPKPLLEVGGKTILDHLLDDIASSGEVDSFVVVSNHKFVEHFRLWVSSRKEKMVVLDDGTTGNDNRLGAVKDVQFAVESLGLDDDLLVIAGDNLLDFSLVPFIGYARDKGTSCVMRFFEASEQRLRRSGVAGVDENDMIVSMEEKPVVPKGNWCIPPFYYYRREDVPLVGKAISEGCATDAPGSFIAWLCSHVPVHAYKMPGRRFDIGNLESYVAVQRDYKGIVR